MRPTSWRVVHPAYAHPPIPTRSSASWRLAIVLDRPCATAIRADEGSLARRQRAAQTRLFSEDEMTQCGGQCSRPCVVCRVYPPHEARLRVPHASMNL